LDPENPFCEKPNLKTKAMKLRIMIAESKMELAKIAKKKPLCWFIILFCVCLILAYFSDFFFSSSS
jgi:hypothetical protein